MDLSGVKLFLSLLVTDVAFNNCFQTCHIVKPIFVFESLILVSAVDIPMEISKLINMQRLVRIAGIGLFAYVVVLY